MKMIIRINLSKLIIITSFSLRCSYQALVAYGNKRKKKHRYFSDREARNDEKIRVSTALHSVVRIILVL